MEEIKPTFDTSSVSNTSIKVFITQPDELLRHNISDDELSRLCENKKGFLQDAFWVAVGGGLGSAAPGISAIINYFAKSPDAPKLPDIISFVILFMCLAVSFVSGVYGRLRANGSVPLEVQIRSRSRREQQ